MLKLRLITGVLMGLVFLACLFLLPWTGFLIFITCVVMAGAWEWANLAGFRAVWQRLIYCAVTLVLMGAVAVYVGMPEMLIDPVRHLLLVGCIWWALALLWVQGYPTSALLWGAPFIRAVMGWLVLIPSWLALAYLDQIDHGPWWVLLMMATVFVADTGAYFAGVAFGRRKLAPQVSPGKSWEGVFGGLLAVALLSLVTAWLAGIQLWWALLLVMLVTAAVSVLGDLLESMVKRHRNIKDSGRLLPGHGGVMDRLDSISAASPVFTLGMIVLGWV